MAVGGLSDVDKLLPVLAALGKRHVAFGVVPPHYDVVGRALVLTLADALGVAFTPEVSEAWVAIYAIIKKTMMGDHYNRPPQQVASTCC